MNLKRSTLWMAVLLFICSAANARVWRVNNNSNVSADFSQLTTAVASPLVQNDDTLYVEGSSIAYSGTATLTKRLVIIGPGFLLSGTGSNPNMQAITEVANAIVRFDSLSSGSQLIGITGTFYIQSNTDNITITRCSGALYEIGPYTANTKMSNILISKSWIRIELRDFLKENIQIINNFIPYYVFLQNTVNGLIRNNHFSSSGSIDNTYLSNNIFTASLTLANMPNCTFRHNIAMGNYIPVTGNGNQNNIPLANLVVQTGSAAGDAYYQLKPGGAGIGAGEPINGVTPDIGPFGTADPYKLSGIPAIPTIYSLTVPSTIPSSATTISITVSTRSNN
jgi:hypothetical protein